MRDSILFLITEVIVLSLNLENDTQFADRQGVLWYGRCSQNYDF